ncbi:uncharacterized protein LOC134196979 isoform X2 [Corticium candelabrum]|uniref:uncharacterized protein LOC134196979 isoform X2 n=1 Tax=Corticium candelabrum TaxID=121492 RepID=UPI002E274C5F|nr:uncharacterized protein LOC134196979 isoform X2 [Corticium candelabrum]
MFYGLPSQPFSWDTVPVFCHMCKPQGLFNDTELDFIKRFAMVTIEKGQGLNQSGYAEEKMIAAGMQIKKANSSIWTLFYMNAILDWPFFKLHDIMLKNPDYWIKHDNGTAVKFSGDSSFPQPANGMLGFNQSNPNVRKMFTSDCVNATRSKAFNGCFIDRANWALDIYNANNTRALHGVSRARVKELADGQVKLLEELQTGVTSSGLIMAKDVGRKAGFTDWPYVNSIFLSDCYCCSDSCADDIEAAINATKRKQLLQCHVNGNLNSQDQFTFALATFLVAAGEHSYFAYSHGWFLEGYGLKWWPEYNKPLGPPAGPAKRTGSVYERSFASGTHVWLDIKQKKANITWAGDIN